MGAMLASALADCTEVFLLTLEEKAPKDYPCSEKVRHCAIPEAEIGRPDEGGNVDRDGNRIRFVKEFKRKHRIAVSISFLEKANFVNVRSRRGERVIVSVRNHYRRKIEEKGDLFSFYCREGTCGADRVAVISEGLRQDLVRLFSIPEDRISVIYNFCRPEALRGLAGDPVPEDIAGFLGGRPYLASVGRLVPQKGQEGLLRVFRRVLKTQPETRLVILGEGPGREGLEQQIRELGLSESVLLAGYRKNPFPVIAGAAAVLSASRYEGLGNSLLEAMALGKAVIAADCQFGPRELLEGNADYGESLADYRVGPCGILCPDLFPGEGAEAGTEAAAEKAAELAADTASEIAAAKAAEMAAAAENTMAEAAVLLLRDPDLRQRLGEAAARRAGEFTEAAALGKWLRLCGAEEQL